MRWMTRLAIFARLCAMERWPVLWRANLLNLLRDGLRVTRLTHSLEGRGFHRAVHVRAEVTWRSTRMPPPPGRCQLAMVEGAAS